MPIILLRFAILFFLIFESALRVSGNNNKRTHYDEDSILSSEPDIKQFFWTGSGDGPPAPPDIADFGKEFPDFSTNTLASAIATVLINCNDCERESSKDEIDLLEDIPDFLLDGLDDQRFWLVTIVQGKSSDSLKRKLINLYKKAFLRQQERHLGLVTSGPNIRQKHSAKYSEPIEEKPSFLWHASVIENPSAQQNSSDDFLILSSESVDFFLEPSKMEQSNAWMIATPYLMEETTHTMDIGESANFSAHTKREILNPALQPSVYVHIRNITQRDGEVEIIYLVFVGNHPIPAKIAARDMRLVRDEEVAEALGYPVQVKAEPYVSTLQVDPEEPNKRVLFRSWWFIVTVVLTTAFLLILLLFIVRRNFSRRRKRSALPPSPLHSYRNEMIKGALQAQMKQVSEENEGKVISMISSARQNTSPYKQAFDRRGSFSSTSSSSGLSEIASALKKRQKKLLRARTKKVSALDQGDHSSPADSAYSPVDTHTPTSYLSMPSIKSFPRSISVEPLSKVLQPISVKHLDIDAPSYENNTTLLRKQERLHISDEKGFGKTQKSLHTKEDLLKKKFASHQLVRLGSMNEDPGVIGPRVWNVQRPSTAAVHDTKLDTLKLKRREEVKMLDRRQRFNELISDSNSLYGSRLATPQSHRSECGNP